jgi:hypothetical protein
VREYTLIDDSLVGRNSFDELSGCVMVQASLEVQDLDALDDHRSRGAPREH